MKQTMTTVDVNNGSHKGSGLHWGNQRCKYQHYPFLGNSFHGICWTLTVRWSYTCSNILCCSLWLWIHHCTPPLKPYRHEWMGHQTPLIYVNSLKYTSLFMRTRGSLYSVCVANFVNRRVRIWVHVEDVEYTCRWIFFNCFVTSHTFV